MLYLIEPSFNVTVRSSGLVDLRIGFPDGPVRQVGQAGFVILIVGSWIFGAGVQNCIPTPKKTF